MADQQNRDQALHDAVAKMVQDGESDDAIMGFVQRWDDVDHPIRAVLGGAAEGTVSGLMNGITALPAALRDSVMDGISIIQGKSPEHAKAFIEGIHNLLPTWEKASPREKAKMVTEYLTTFGMGGGEAALATSRPVIRTIGRGLEYAGDHPFAARMAGGAGVVAGLARGEPSMVGAGVGGMMLPPVMKAAGEKLIRFGGGVPKQDLKNLTHAAKAEREAWQMVENERTAAETGMRKEMGAATKELDTEAAAKAADAAKQSDFMNSIRLDLSKRLDDLPNRNAKGLADLRKQGTKAEQEAATVRKASAAREEKTRTTEERADLEQIRKDAKKPETPQGIGQFTPEEVQTMKNSGFSEEQIQKLSEKGTVQPRGPVRIMPTETRMQEMTGKFNGQPPASTDRLPPVRLTEPSKSSAPRTDVNPEWTPRDLEAWSEISRTHPEWDVEMIAKEFSRQRSAREGGYRRGELSKDQE